MYMLDNIFETNDLVMYQEGGKIMSGGYAVNSILMNSGQSPLNSYQYGGSNKKGSNTKSLESKDINSHDINSNDINSDDKVKKDTFFDNLAVPVGIFYINNECKKPDYEKANYNTFEERYMISDDIYDKLFDLASFKKSKNSNKINKISRKNIKKDNQHKKTKRSKNVNDKNVNDKM